MEFNQPKGLWVLALGKLWDTFSYFGTQTILALYFMHIFHIDRNTSYLLYGAYAAIAFGSPVFGGMVADRWLGSQCALMFSCLLNILGNLLLVSFDRYLFCLGLALSLVGSGIYKSTSTQLVGSLYHKDDTKKESGFTWFYLSINVGGTLGPLAYGAISYQYGWNYAFLCSALGLLLSAFWLLLNWRHLKIKEPPKNTVHILLTMLVILFICALLSVPFYYPIVLTPIIFGLFLLSILYLIHSFFQYQGKEKRHLFGLFSLSFLGMFYFATGLQVGTTITLFLQSRIQHGQMKTQFPASTFSMLYPLFVLLLAPVITQLWKKMKAHHIDFKAPTRLAIGIALAAFGMFFFSLAAITNLILLSVILGYLLLSAGELVLTPAVYTVISDRSPEKMKSTMMGCWFLFIAIGSYFSSLIAVASHTIADKLQFKEAYYGEFICIALFTLIIAIITFLSAPLLKKWLT